ncbi:hypothetical protein ACIQPR_09925 [Streptomyces sp. NPDC091280]|uniref:hypothetical protein n=1 Tax=Streptomyces sp. NPDC091280 TaxID=3365984 RepID=UPI00382641B8
MTFLDLMFGMYVAARAGDGEKDVYDASDSGEVQEWWGDFDHVLYWVSPDRDEGEERRKDVEDGEAPAGVDGPQPGVDLDAWQTDFIAFLDAEGLARHPEQWPEAAAGWAERHRQRQLAGVAPGELSEDEWWGVLRAFFADVQDEAVQKWGLGVWDEHRSRWVAAVIRDEDLFSPLEGLVEYRRTLPRQAADIAELLAAEVCGLPPLPVLGGQTFMREVVPSTCTVQRQQGGTGHARDPAEPSVHEVSPLHQVQ